MNYLNRHQLDLGADSQDDARISTEALQLKVDQLAQQLDALGSTAGERAADLRHQLAMAYIDLSRGQTDHQTDRSRTSLGQPAPLQSAPAQSAWNHARQAFDVFLGYRNWEQAALVCDTLFRCGVDDSLIALGHGLWLSITFPVDVSLTISQLQHVIDETPESSDGAAVAAAVAAYVNEIRGNEHQDPDIDLAVGQMLNDVARRHAQVDTQEAFNQWFERLELNDPGKFLVRMRNIIDVLVQDNWWFDRNELQAMIPGGS